MVNFTQMRRWFLPVLSTTRLPMHGAPEWPSSLKSNIQEHLEAAAKGRGNLIPLMESKVRRHGWISEVKFGALTPGGNYTNSFVIFMLRFHILDNVFFKKWSCHKTYFLKTHFLEKFLGGSIEAPLLHCSYGPLSSHWVSDINIICVLRLHQAGKISPQ